ncbi:DEKNAAC100864 [Brettanomyces naardenensis]|uniref:DEKNAAC100864 n=1 Tax=Brettanomyces naardenensis TaxID=13370 RepID=A0A448YF20_BRENA|nr:DEKNAAC100864 [Brettanomyces naardenensis]
MHDLFEHPSFTENREEAPSKVDASGDERDARSNQKGEISDSVSPETNVPAVVIQPTEEHEDAAGGGADHLRATFVDQEAPKLTGRTSSGRKLATNFLAKTTGAAFPGILNTDRLLPFPTTKTRRGSRRYLGSKAKKERAGWEPGVDVHTTNVLLNTPGSIVTISDYSEERYRVERYEVYSEMENDGTRRNEEGDHVEFCSRHRNSSDSDSRGDSDSMSEIYQSSSQYMADVEQSKEDLKKALEKRPSWGKVRWINVNGLSWEVISIIGDYYSLHRLAIEDMVDIPQRTKVDMYPSHLFAVLPLLKLVTVETPLAMARSFFRQRAKDRLERVGDFAQGPIRATTKTASSNMMSTSSMNGNNIKPFRTQSRASTHGKRRFKTLLDKIMEDPHARTLTDSTSIPVNKKSDNFRKLRDIELRRPLYRRNLGVGEEQLSVFLTTDGTVISFLEHSANDIEKAILPRLSSEYTLLRTSCDSSILFESIVDASVDLISPVVTAYNKIKNEFEIDILTNPGMQRTGELHLMVNELTLLRSAIQPISSVVVQLKNQKVFRKFITEDSTLYLSDINDHLISYVQDIDSMTQTIENLLNLVFNILSVETNRSMQRLSLITVIFLPLSFWTGYYGMNFEKFGDLQRDVSFYWELAIPFCVVLMIIIMRKEIRKSLSELRASIVRRINEFNYRRQQEEEDL